jgi:hypothetical protein
MLLPVVVREVVERLLALALVLAVALPLLLLEQAFVIVGAIFFDGAHREG